MSCRSKNRICNLLKFKHLLVILWEAFDRWVFCNICLDIFEPFECGLLIDYTSNNYCSAGFDALDEACVPSADEFVVGSLRNILKQEVSLMEGEGQVYLIQPYLHPVASSQSLLRHRAISSSISPIPQ